MTTLTLKLPLAVAKGLARAADILGMSHQQAGEQAVRLFVRSCAPPVARKTKRRQRKG